MKTRSEIYRIFFEKYNKLNLKLGKHRKKIEDKHLKFTSLSPTANCDEKDTYCKSISWALEQKDINNIAITGSYGSGKSSIIKKFREKHRNYECLSISLANFNDIDNNNLCKDQIEYNILKHLTYSCKNNSLPDSKISRIYNHSKLKLFLYSFCSVVWLLCILILCFPELYFINKFNSLSPWHDGHLCFYIECSILLLGIGFIMRKILRPILNTRINKLSIGKSEIELKENKSSILYKHLDEIIYFFEKHKYDVVIIEDLDRFDMIDIFTTLREINIILNNTARLKKRKISFIYAVKDDFFKINPENRIKFFDFIIPIIPHINVNNSADLLIKKAADIGVGLEQSFLVDIGLYISDTRFICNIFNEFEIYRKVLSDKLNIEKLFAMIVYKNLMPDDFILLQNNDGIVFSIFRDKENYIKKRLNEIDANISKLNSKHDNFHNIIDIDIESLRAILLYEFISKYPDAKAFNINNKQVTFSEAKSDENFNKLLSNRTVSYYTHWGGPYTTDYPFSFNDIIINNKSYREHYDNIYNSKRNNIINKINDLKTEKLEVINNPLRKLVDNITDENLKKLDKNPIVKYFLKNGYIDEDYHYLFSHIHEDGRFTTEEAEYLLNIKSQSKGLIKSNYEFKITNINNFIKQMQPDDYENELSLNISLMNELLSNSYEHKTKINKLLDVLHKGKGQTFYFVELYIREGEHKKRFLEYLCEKWEYIWVDIFDKLGLNEEKKIFFMQLFFENYDKQRPLLINQQSLNSLNNFISNCADFTSLMEIIEDTEKVKIALVELKVKFRILNNSNNSDLEDFIYNNNLYAINQKMLSFFINKYTENRWRTIPTYSNIKQLDCMCKYIEDNIDYYVENVLLKSDRIQESQDIIVLLLNNNKIKEENKLNIIESKNFKIKRIETVKSDILLKYIIVYNKFVENTDNISYIHRKHVKKIDDYI